MPSDVQEIIFSISELNQLARIALEKGLPACRVRGEVSNFSRAGSGHWYFTLKDEEASVRCVMFRSRNQYVDWLPRDGDTVEARVQPSLYEQRGEYQLLVDALRKSGQGFLFEAFLRLKEKLEVEGLFAPERKRPIPRIPHTIGVITSPQAAALRDVLSTIQWRWPGCTLILYPTPVQGEAAPGGLIQALKMAGDRKECDVLLLVRGGGSLEDLVGFNDEMVARAISSCPLPLVTGIGHETDFTIADFVADQRAPTPTGAAQSVTPSRQDIASHLRHLGTRLCQFHMRRVETLNQKLDGLSRRLAHPRNRITTQNQELRHVRARLVGSMRTRIQTQRTRLLWSRLSSPNRVVGTGWDKLAELSKRLCTAWKLIMSEKDRSVCALHSHLELLSPLGIMARGYSIVRDQEGRIMLTTDTVHVGQRLHVTLAKGVIVADVRGIGREMPPDSV